MGGWLPRLGALTFAGVVAAGAACGGDDGPTGVAADAPDAASDDDGATTTPPPPGFSPDASFAQTVVLAAQTALSPKDPLTWGSILKVTITGNGGSYKMSTAIPREQIADPTGLAYREASSEVFVANRNGWPDADAGGAGSISRFVYDKAKGTFSPSGTVTGNGLDAVGPIAFSPLDGELFATTLSAVSRFTFDAQGNAVPHGTLASGWWWGIAVAPDGKRLYVTNTTNILHQFDVASGAELAEVTAPGGDLRHLAWRGRDLYAVTSDKVYRFTVDANDQPSPADTVAIQSPAALAISIAPSGTEMFLGVALGANVGSIDVVPLAGSDWPYGARYYASGFQIGSVLVLP